MEKTDGNWPLVEKKDKDQSLFGKNRPLVDGSVINK